MPCNFDAETDPFYLLHIGSVHLTKCKSIHFSSVIFYFSNTNQNKYFDASAVLFTEARARIEGPDNKEVHVKQRSRVKLTCVVDLGRGGESAAVFWYLDGQSLDWLGQTGPGRGVQVTEKRGTQLVSTLSIERADMHHAGKFTCSPSYAKPDTVTLHVIDSKLQINFHFPSQVD